MPPTTTNRGRTLFAMAVVLLILERMAMIGLALANYGQSYFNWISVVLPLTHIAVVLFLVYTSDMLIYWLVILWGGITTGNFGYMLWERWIKANTTERAEWFGRMLPKWGPIAALVLFHLVITLVLLLPVVRAFLAAQRSKLDFQDVPAPPPVAEADVETKKI